VVKKSNLLTNFKRGNPHPFLGVSPLRRKNIGNFSFNRCIDDNPLLVNIRIMLNPSIEVAHGFKCFTSQVNSLAEEIKNAAFNGVLQHFRRYILVVVAFVNVLRAYAKPVMLGLTLNDAIGPTGHRQHRSV